MQVILHLFPWSRVIVLETFMFQEAMWYYYRRTSYMLCCWKLNEYTDKILPWHSSRIRVVLAKVQSRYRSLELS
jgi:hypothetical protein